jgi:hypothetical protein
MDFLNKALEQAKQLQQLTAEAMKKSYDQAQPLVEQGVKQAQDLQKSLIEQAPNVSAAAKDQYDAALQHAGTFIATGKTVLDAGTNAAQQHFTTLSEQATKMADATRNAVHQATAPKEPPTP